MNDIHLDYSLYDNTLDLVCEKDVAELKRECMRQRIYIEQLAEEKRKAEAEAVMMKHSKLNWSKLAWSLVKDFKAGKQSKEDFLAEYERVMEGMVRIT